MGTFADQEGGMGQLIDTEHPILKEFPTDFHTDWQWWIMASKRAVILPHPMKTIITEMDSYAFLRPMAQMIEFRCLKGKVLLSTMELHKSQQYPEVRRRRQFYTYLSGENFEPAEEITEEVKHLWCEVKIISGGGKKLHGDKREENMNKVQVWEEKVIIPTIRSRKAG